MPPAQRGLLYSVPDVVDAIQNGQSDSEMESDVTDASHKEAHKAATQRVIMWTSTPNHTDRPDPVTGITG